MEAIKTDMTTVLTSMTSWWTATPAANADCNTDTSKEKKETPEKESAESSPTAQDPEQKSNENTEEKSEKEATDTQKHAAKDQALDLNIEEISNKAVEAAKEWGCK